MEHEILNFSKIEEDPFGDLDLDKSNITEIIDNWQGWKPTTFELILNYVYLISSIIRFFVSIGAVLADILIVYLILRYKRLRKNFNLYIVHYAIMNFANNTTTPIFLIVHLLFSTGYEFFFFIYCYMGMIEETFMYMSFLFATFLGLDWTISCLRPHYLKKIELAYRFKFVILYSFLLTFAVINCVSCNISYGFAPEVLFFTMPFLIIALLAMHVLRRRVVLDNDQLKTEHYLWISTIGLGCFVPIYILDVLSRLLGISIHYAVMSVIFFLEHIASIIPTLTPILILVYLIKWNKHVRMAFDTTFRKVSSTYGSDNLDDASDNEEIIVDEGEKNAQSASNGAGTHNILVP